MDLKKGKIGIFLKRIRYYFGQSVEVFSCKVSPSFSSKM